VVLTNYSPEGVPLPVTVQRPFTAFRHDATYLVTGGAGGFGSRLIRLAVRTTK
jgi:FlaA1/EpsC-like NDP-sugar epimerase